MALGHPELVLFALEATVLCLLTGTFRERLRETEAHLGRIFEDAPVGILILDGGTRIRKVNPAFRQFLGRLPTADNEIADVVHADSQPQVRAFLDRLTHERATANVAEIGFLNGPNLVWANLRGSRIQKDSGRAPISMVMAEDITERRRTEQALRETEARLQRGDRMEALGLLAGWLAHDFNNLLAVTFACCDNLAYSERPFAREPPGCRRDPEHREDGR